MLCHHQCSSQCLCIIPIFSFYDLNCSRIRADCELWRVFSVCSNIPFTYQRTLSENLTLFIGEGTADCQPVKRFVCKQTRLHTVGHSIENCIEDCRDLWWFASQSNCVQCIKLKVCLHHHTDHTLSLKRGTKLVKTKHSSYQICKSSQQRKYREDLTRRD